jgi:hypothetical protein
MTFDNYNPPFTPRMKQVAESGFQFFKDYCGRNGLKIGEEICEEISWKPTFHHKGRIRIVAAEVSDTLYPAVLKIAAHDIMHFDSPVSVYVVCPLEVFQADSKQTVVNQLKKHGFGILTVDDSGKAVRQHPCIPLAQNIRDEELEKEIGELKQKLKVAFRSAHSSFHVDEGQGLQKAGQIVEAMVNTITDAAKRSGLIVPGSAAADKIDSLYALVPFKPHRAALGGARDFVREYRNTASHPAGSAKEAVDKIRKCRSGFFDAIRTVKNLSEMADAQKYRLNINIT